MSDWFDTLKEVTSQFKGFKPPKDRRDYEKGLYVTDLLSAARDPKGLIYSAMMDGNEYRDNSYGLISPTPESYERIIRNKDQVVKKRGHIPRNLASLYIYGNDLKQFKPLSSKLSKLGVEYDNYLKSIGRNPDEIITYKGNISTPVILPKEIQDQLPSFINSNKNRTYGVEQTFYDTNPEDDDVAGHLQRLTMINGIPYVVNSDLWDFEPTSYKKRWGNANNMFTSSDTEKKQNRNRTYYQAKLLDKVGNPFILKDFHPVKFVDVDDYYDLLDGEPRPHSELELDVMEQFGWLPEVTVTAKRKKK